MLKKTITYTDFNDDEVTEDFYFHLSEAELAKMELTHEGGLKASLERIIDARDGNALIAEFESLVLGSYGKKSADGRRFIKTDQVRDEFVSSEAYSVFFMELLTDTSAMVDFVNGVVPKNLAERVAKVTQLEAVPDPPEKEDVLILPRARFEEMTRDEIADLAPKLASGEVKIEDSVPTPQ